MFALILMTAVATSACTTHVEIKQPPPRHDDPLAVQVNEAVLAADRIYANPQFWRLVEKRSWVGTYDATTAMSGSEVRGALEHLRPTKQRYAARPIGFWAHVPLVGRWRKGAYGSTTTCIRGAGVDAETCGRIFVSDRHFPVVSASFRVNTVAHEMTHTIGDGTGTCGCDGPTRNTRFTDTTDGGLADGMMVWLVSYGIGDLAQCYEDSKGSVEATWECFDQRMNGERCNRPIVECCPSTADTPAIVEARQHSARCLALSALCPKPSEVSCSYGLPASR